MIAADDVAEALRRRLSMFVLRSKVALTDSGMAILGVGGPRTEEALATALGVAPSGGEVAPGAHGTRVVRWPDGRALVLTRAIECDAAFEALARVATPVDRAAWDWLGVRAGVPMITAATADQFVAQTANMDALGALDFRKGCYPGQEIVARTQYLGRLKERLFAFAADVAPPSPGTRLFGEPFGDQSAGTVVNSAPAPGGSSAFLAVVQTAAADAGPLRLGAPDGPLALRQALPYALPEPVAPRRLPR
jgi:folate-binding protein YgfZ